jgi:hypothetical protein
VDIAIRICQNIHKLPRNSAAKMPSASDQAHFAQKKNRVAQRKTRKTNSVSPSPYLGRRGRGMT